MDGLRAGRLYVPEEELSERFSRSSGPGGQSVNTTDSRVELRWDIAASGVLTDHQRSRLRAQLGGRLVDDVVSVTASEYRSQLRNREAARVRMGGFVADALAPPAAARRATRPTRGSKERRLAGKKLRSAVKQERRVPPRDG